jgi:hypothetical protein
MKENIVMPIMFLFFLRDEIKLLEITDVHTEVRDGDLYFYVACGDNYHEIRVIDGKYVYGNKKKDYSDKLDIFTDWIKKEKGDGNIYEPEIN